jgi:predicted RNA methylase
LHGVEGETMSATLAERRSALRHFVGRLGYGTNMVREDFPVWAPDAVRFAHLVAFTDAPPAPQDMTTAAITGFVGNGGPTLPMALALARELAAPTAVLALDDKLELWWVGPTDEVKLSDVRYDAVPEGAAALRSRLDPTAVVAAKQAEAQLALFPIDVSGLLQHARHASASRLQVRVESAMTRATAAGVETAEDLDRASRLVIGTMAALMIADKLEQRRPSSGAAIWKTASSRYPHYFNWLEVVTADETNLLADLLDDLGRDVTYTGLDPVVVSHVYETALVSAASRKDLGIFYTPPDLASAILDHLPIEELPPGRRTVLDPACGSGSLLLSAYNRLRRLAPPDLTTTQRHRHATTLLRGFDADPFAVQIAGLALLLNALPQGNGWQVTSRDILTTALPDVKADIVVSNPPWGQRGRGIAQTADRFVDQILDIVAHDGFIGLVVPASWLSTRGTTSARERFTASCDIFEIWRLPEDAFYSAEMAPAVLFAQRRPQVGHYVFRRALRRHGWRDGFLGTERIADVLVLTEPGAGLQERTLLRGPLDGAAEALAVRPTLSTTVTDLGRGPVPTPPITQRGGAGPFKWLRDLRGMSTLTAIPQDKLTSIRYPEEFNYRSDTGDRYQHPKILVSAVRKADNPWRLRVFLDTRGGVIPRESLFMLIPAEESHLEAFAALLSSSVASAWVDTLNPSRSIDTGVLAAFPVPDSVAAWEDLTVIGRRLVASASIGQLTANDLRHLDEHVCDLYGLDERTKHRLREHFRGFVGPEGFLRYHQHLDERRPRQGDPLRHYGAVMDVGQDRIRLWIPGMTADEGDWMALPTRFLGRHVRPGATFEVVMSGDEIHNGFFEFQPDSYTELEDLARTLG